MDIYCSMRDPKYNESIQKYHREYLEHGWTLFLHTLLIIFIPGLIILLLTFDPENTQHVGVLKTRPALRKSL